jgi:hypothetical protein
MKTHLKTFVTHLGGKLVKGATRHGTFAKHFRKLAVETDPVFNDLAEAHEAAQADDTELAQHCAEFAKILDSTQKAMGGFDDLDALVPSRISAVSGDAPPSSLRMVPRSGQREISQFSPLDKSDKASETISKITSLD